MRGKMPNLAVALMGAALAAVLAMALLARLQFSPPPVAHTRPNTPSNAPDYYIGKLRSTGLDRHGEKYQLTAQRLVHYPADRRALLSQPRLIQHRRHGVARRVRADAGYWYDDGDTMMLFGRIKMTEGESVATLKTMTIRLKDGAGG